MFIKGKVYELLSYYFSLSANKEQEQCPFIDNEERLVSGYFNLYYDYNTLDNRTYKDVKNLLSHNDINKKLKISKKKYNEPLKRNKNYINRTSILEHIYLDDVIKLGHSGKFLLYSNSQLIISNEVVNKNNLFIEIKLNDDLCKLWHIEEQQFVVYSTINSKFM